MEPESEGDRIGRRITRSLSIRSSASAPSNPCTPVQRSHTVKKLACKARRDKSETRREQRKKSLGPLNEEDVDSDDDSGEIKFTF